MPLLGASWAIKAAQTKPDGRGRYGRFSKNRDGRSQSVTVQLAEGRDFFDMQDWLVNEGLIFKDDNISASEYSTKERPGFEKMCDAIRAQRMWLLVVTEVSRITRVMEVGINFVKLAQDAGGLMIMTTEGKQFDLMTTTGVHDFLQAVLEASRESGTKSDRFKRNKRSVAKQGRYHGGRRPYGRVGAIKDKFDRVTNSGEVGQTPLDFEVTHLNEDMANKLLDGWPLLSVVKDLKRRAIKNASGNDWTAPVLRKTLQSPLLIGKRLYDGRLYPDGDETVIPPIMAREKWDALQFLFKSEERMKGVTEKGKLSYLFTGILGCTCGNWMTGHTRKDAGGSKRTYMCRLYDNSGNKIGCGRRRLAEPIELLLTDAILYRYNSPGFMEALKQAYGQDSGDQELHLTLTRAKELEAKMTELEDAYLTGTFDLQQLARIQSSVQEELKTINAKAERLLSGRGASVALSGNISEVWERADIHQRRTLTRLIVKRATVEAVDPKAPRKTWTHEGTGKKFIFNPDLISVEFKF